MSDEEDIVIHRKKRLKPKDDQALPLKQKKRRLKKASKSLKREKKKKKKLYNSEEEEEYDSGDNDSEGSLVDFVVKSDDDESGKGSDLDEKDELNELLAEAQSFFNMEEKRKEQVRKQKEAEIDRYAKVKEVQNTMSTKRKNRNRFCEAEDSNQPEPAVSE